MPAAAINALLAAGEDERIGKGGQGHEHRYFVRRRNPDTGNRMGRSGHHPSKRWPFNDPPMFADGQDTLSVNGLKPNKSDRTGGLTKKRTRTGRGGQVRVRLAVRVSVRVRATSPSIGARQIAANYSLVQKESRRFSCPTSTVRMHLPPSVRCHNSALDSLATY